MSDRNDVIMIDLDRPREIRFGHKALKRMTAALGKDINNIEIDASNLEEFEKIMYFGLMSDAVKNNETLKLEDMEDLLDQAKTFGEIIEKMNLALNAAFGQLEIDEKNFQRIVENNKK
ncbi:hypothetical protein [Neobacillus mesonae]|uniref:hypothetical protein n=1 Tax=Neobacillus mesonae TaxID=1193713 RepID=UPI002E1C3C23|nr:hypothetical protein [Neobacillus mesonae]